MHAVARVLYSCGAMELAVAVQNYAEDLERGLGGRWIFRLQSRCTNEPLGQTLPTSEAQWTRFSVWIRPRTSGRVAMIIQIRSASLSYQRSVHNVEACCRRRQSRSHGSGRDREPPRLNGTPFRMDLDEARRLFASAAEARYARSALSLGLMHLVGEGGPPNLAEARRLLVLGFEIDTDEAEAKRLIRALRINEWAEIRLHPHTLVLGCHFHLGVMLYEGIGGPADGEGSGSLPAADAGMPEAQVYIGDTVMKSQVEEKLKLLVNGTRRPRKADTPVPREARRAADQAMAALLAGEAAEAEPPPRSRRQRRRRARRRQPDAGASSSREPPPEHPTRRLPDRGREAADAALAPRSPPAITTAATASRPPRGGEETVVGEGARCVTS